MGFFVVLPCSKDQVILSQWLLKQLQFHGPRDDHRFLSFSTEVQLHSRLWFMTQMLETFLLYPSRDQEPLFMAKQVNKVERTLSWVMDQDPDPSSSSGASGHSTPEPSGSKTSSMSTLANEGPIKGNSKPCTLPTSSMNSALRSVWSETKESKPWPESMQNGLGLDHLGTRMAQTNDQELRERLERLEIGEKLWGAWDPAKAW